MYSNFVEFAMAQGVPIETITLILMLPIVVTMIALFRQVIGIKAFGIYTPALLIFAFLAIDIESETFLGGIKYGIPIFVAVILIGTLMRMILKYFRLLYLPRVAIVISVVALSTLMLLVFGGMMGRTGLANVSIFPILIMIALVEKFVAVQIEKGNKQAIILSLETLIITLFGYLLARWGVLISILQQFPWVVLVAIILNIALGKWTGLRLMEYVRFKEIIKHNKNNDK